MVADNNRDHEDVMNWEQFSGIFLSRWYYFIASTLIALGIAVYYIMQSTPIYTRNAQLLIKDDKQGKTASALQEFKDMGLIASTSNVNNEIYTISAPVMMHEVVKRLQLDLQIEMDEGLHKRPLYDDAPVSLQFSSPLPNDYFCSFKMKLKSRNEAELYDFNVQGEIIEKSIQVKLNAGDVQTPAGKMQIKTLPTWDDAFIGEELSITKYPLAAIGNLYSARLGVELCDKESSVINISMTDESPQRADDVIMTLVDVYNEKWIQDNNRIAESTNTFITERLETITKELGDVDEQISDYKSTNLLPDIAASLAKDMQQSSRNYETLLQLNNQYAMTKFVREYLDDKDKKDQLLPSNVGINSSGVENMITAYNQLLLERMSFVENSGNDNPAVRDLDRKLASQKSAIIRSMDNLLVQLKQQIANIEKSEREINGQIASNPQQVKTLQSVERQQKVKEALYIYLLQKREENELSRTFTAWNSSIIQPPIGSNAPSSPRKRMILLVAFLIGLAVPAAFLYLRESLNHTVRGRKDLEGLQIPLISEIPNLQKRRGWWQRRKRQERRVVVKPDSRDIINESFRLLRTKLNYYVESNGNIKVIMLTSFNPGSGKSFITANLGTTYAIRGSKILIIDFDIRHCSLSDMIPGKHMTGLTSFLGGMETDINSLIIRDAFCPNCDVLPVGIIPPNPTEILQAPQMKTLFDTVRSQYDYILLDCPPIEIIADTDIIKEHADMSLFVVRAGLMDRRLLKNVDALYHENTYKKLAMILNGTEYVKGKYGNYRYGYAYGYYGGVNSNYFSEK